MKKITLLFTLLFITLLSVNNEIIAQTTSGSLGTSTSSSATRGPFQRSDSASNSVYSRANLVYTATELTSIGITNGDIISQINWEVGSSNVITATGDAILNVYMKNSSSTGAAADLWSNYINGATLVGTYTFNTSNNFPGASGYISFPLGTSFTYTGGSIEIAVDWDCSQLVTTSANSNTNLLLSGNGSLNWRWSSTAHSSSVYRSGSSSAPSDINKTPKTERVNTQFVYQAPASCLVPTNLNAANTTTTSADLSWTASITGSASSYEWKVVASGAGSGGTAVDGGNIAGTSVTTNSLAQGVSYDLFVETDCGADGLSGFAGPYTFVAALPTNISGILGTSTSSSATRGPFQRSDSTSNSVYSRANLVYTATELTSIGISNGDIISQINWEVGSSNVITATGDAILNVYMKNSSSTGAAADLWSNYVSGATLVGTYTFNTSNNFPGASGFIAFPLGTNFTYTGGSIEIAVDWDCSQLVTTSVNSNTNLLLSGNGSLNWRWSSTAHSSSVYRSGSSSAPSDINKTPKTERVNTQFVYSILPVEMTYFIGNKTSEGNLLEWETATELINEGFEVQKSIDGKNWEVIGFVAGNGTTIEVSNYEFLDERVSSNENYYRLKQLDTDGKFDFSRTILIMGESQDVTAWKTYPNPVKSQLTVEGFEGVATIYNILGQPLKTINIVNNMTSLSLTDLESGQYFIEMVATDGTRVVRQIVKIVD